MHRLFTNGFSHRLSYCLPLLSLLVGLSMALLAPTRALAADFTVNNTGDTVDAAPGNGLCADAGNACTLRAAIMEANALAGADTITLPAGTYTLSRVGSDDNATNGDLDVTGPLTINGNSQATTIIQAGTTNSNGIDKIFSFNPVGNLAGFAVSLANLTLRFGRNPESYANNNGFGGCLDFDAGTNAAAPGSLTLNTVTVTDCSTTDADGGGMALFLNKGGTVNISNVTIQNNRAGTNGNATSGLGGGIFFGTTDTGNTVNVTMSNSTIANNQALGGVKQGGGLFIFGGAGAYNYALHGVTISGNSAASDGGGIYSTAPLVIDQGTLISNNSSGRAGGGIWLNHTNRTSTINGVTISGNQASDGGGGIRLDSGAPGNLLNLSFSRLVNNTAGSGKGSGLSVNNGSATATNNWWGCSTGPSAAPCDTAQIDPAVGGGAAGMGSVNFTPWLQVSLTAATSPLVTGQSTGLTASFLTNSNGDAVSLSNLSVLLGLPVTWSAVGGTISGQQTTLQASGTATANYQATAAAAGNRAVAKVDNDSTTSGSNLLNLTVNKANTTATITADTPDPSMAGQAVTANYNVTVNAPSTGTPTGNVTVSDGVDSCTATVAAGQCTITLTTSGARTLTATYVGDANFNGSTAAGVPHQVNAVDNTPPTVASITRADANPTSAATVRFTVTFNENVTGVDASDLTLVTSDLSGATIANVTGSDATRTVAVNTGTVNTGTGSGVIRLDVVDDDSIVDGANNPLGGIGVGNGNFAGGNQEYSIINIAPQITTQPSSQTVCAGALASFSAAASGTPSPLVQWQVSSDSGATWSDISGETNTTLPIAATAADNGKQYHALFTNHAGSATTAAATLTVNSAPVISTQPTNQTVNAGQAVSFSAAASGSPALAIQWQVSTDNGATWGALTGETAATLTFTAQSGDNGKQYRAVFTESCGSATTNAATLTVNNGQAPIVLSSNKNGKVGGLSYRDEDLIQYDPANAQWSLLFDGSAVGLGKVDVDGFAVLPGSGRLLFSVDQDFALAAAHTVNQQSLAVDDADILEFIPTQLGATTRGKFQLYFDGSAHGLDSSGEDIDALDFDTDGNLLISVTGAFKAGGVTGNDEDLFAFLSNGTWQLYFDGGNVGLTRSDEDVIGVWIDHAKQQIYLSTLDNYSVPGLSGNEDDIFICTYHALGVATACTFTHFFDGKRVGFTKDAIDALSIGVLPPPSLTAAITPTAETDPTPVDDTIEAPGDDADEPNELDGTETDATEIESVRLFLPLITQP